jgi:hypothetical protein
MKAWQLIAFGLICSPGLFVLAWLVLEPFRLNRCKRPRFHIIRNDARLVALPNSRIRTIN